MVVKPLLEWHGSKSSVLFLCIIIGLHGCACFTTCPTFYHRGQHCRHSTLVSVLNLFVGVLYGYTHLPCSLSFLCGFPKLMGFEMSVKVLNPSSPLCFSRHVSGLFIIAMTPWRICAAFRSSLVAALVFYSYC